MAENLFLLKRRIRTAKNIAQIAKAMEMISASKIKRAQIAVENNKPYAHRITRLTQDLLNKVNLEKFSSPYLLTSGATDKPLLIVISPDKGLCGSLNTNLYKKLLDIDPQDSRIVTIGKKAEQFASRMKLDILASFPMGTSLPNYSLVFQLIHLIDPMVQSGEINKVEVLYTEFEAIFTQYPLLTQLLPLDPVTVAEEDTDTDLPFLVEPDIETLLSDLLPTYIEVKLYQTLIEAYTSEQAARMIAMQNAKNNAKDVAEFLTLTYNKRRQERITNELLDLANSSQPTH